MEIGCCVPHDEIPAARQAGFAFAELSVARSLCPLEDEAWWRARRAEIQAGGLPILATNVFFPGDWRLTGPQADLQATRRYAQTAVQRVAELGVRVMVLGSGGARRVPDGYPREAALDQLRATLAAIGDIAAPHGITIALEPLRKAETNLVHTVAEAIEIVRPLAHPHVAALADLYHIYEEGEPLDNVLAAGPLLAHVHVADTGRLAPGTGQYDYPGFFARLRQVGYQGGVSVECKWQEWAREAPAARAFLERMAAGL